MMKILVFLLFLITATAVGNEVLCLESERMALLMFKKDLKDPSGRLSSWNTSSVNCCEWAGVVCDNLTGHVHEIQLRSPCANMHDKLGGKLNPSLVYLKHLTYLDLSCNSFNSSVPLWIDSLVNLVHLDLSNCGFYDQIPSGLQNMTKLEYLNLSSNNFNSTFPRWLSGFARLQVLAVSDNLIQGEVPDTIGNLTSLVTLDLSQNRLEGVLPKSLANLCRLEGIYLLRNRFSGDLSFLTGCMSKRLQFLYLGSNMFSGLLPSNLGQLTNLREVDLVDNKLTGALPTSLGQLQELEYVVVSLNLLVGIVSEAHFRNCSRLKILRASGNKLSFKPSRRWVPPFQLTGLSLRTWQLGPEFPHWIIHMKHLEYLSLANTGIADSIPAWFWSRTSQLRYLNLSSNLIHGRIPSLLDIGIGSGRNVVVDLKDNLINGSLPSISSNVSLLDLSHNRISGSMDRFLCDNAMQKNNRLEILELGINSISGEIPDCWKNWPLLRVLRIQSTNLTGKIPSSIGLLTRLQSLHLRRNNLSGEVPFTLQNCADLMVLDIGRNHLTGRVPFWINQLSKLIILNLRLNMFWGEIPVQVCHLTSIQMLDLAGNNLSGSIPSCFVNFSVMTGKQRPSDHIYYSAVDAFGGVAESQYLILKGRFGLYSNNLQWVMTLDLSDNNLSGKIPVELTWLVELQGMNLSMNSLAGSIPENVGNMELLESLDISMNHLSGEIPPGLSVLTFLSHLNLSYNNLTGKIPSGTQLQGFDASSFVGNELCGPPLSKNCNENEETPDSIEDEESSDTSLFGGDRFGFILSLLFGFVFGFWAVLGPLVISMSWRTTYFGFLTSIGNYMYYVSVKFWRRVIEFFQ